MERGSLPCLQAARLHREVSGAILEKCDGHE